MAQPWGAFQLLERISESEATETFRAQNEKGELVWLQRARAQALKDEGFAPLMLTDLAAAAALRHPSVVPLLQSGEVGGVPYRVQPVVPGWTLSELLGRSLGTPMLPLSAPLAAAVVVPLLDALSAAHALAPPLLHRDLAPDNVVVTEQGKVLLNHFGMARAQQRAGGSHGFKKAYVSPEQARGLPLDPRSEVFAAGLILFELSCGRLPAEGAAGDVISRIASGELDAPAAVNPQVDARLAEVLQRALAPAPEQRFESAAQFAAALRPFLPRDADAQLGQWADQVDSDAPTQSHAVKPPAQVTASAVAPLPLQNRAAAPAPATAPAAKQPGPAAAPKRPRRGPLLLLASVGLAALAGLYVGVRDAPLQPAHAPWPSTTVTSVPNGAEVWLDGEKLKGVYTPASVELEPGVVHDLELHYGMLKSRALKVQNAKSVEVNLNSGQVTMESRSSGPPPRAPDRPKPTKLAAEVDPGPPPAPEPLHVAIQLPLDLDLDFHFQLPVDNMGSRELKKGDRLEQLSQASVFLDEPEDGPGGLDTWAVWNANGDLKVHRMSTPLISDADRSYYLFAVSRVGGSHSPAELKHQEREVWINGLAVPEVKNIFEVPKLDPDAAYCLTVRGPESTPPLPPSPIFLGVVGVNVEDLPVLDGEAVSGVTLLGKGEHQLRGVQAVWFTLPSLEGVTPHGARVHLDVCKNELRKPGPIK